MPVRSSRKIVRRHRHRAFAASFEALESRQFLTVSSDSIIHPAIQITPAATGSTVGGYTPQQIRDAYGFDQVSINGITGDGTGQTIAIIGAYDDPNISADLHTFDQKFGLTDPAFQKVSQTGGSTASLQKDAGWSLETSLDVEWAHAMAPNAKILLVEANTDSLGNLMSAVDYARHVPDVSVVSMSWGGGEFWGETSYDQYFTTPAGHQGVTFVAASGDSGSWWGPSWPASSPNVLAVGGTTLNISSTGSTSETGWYGSGGGISELESTPSYQQGVQGTGGRTTPDVSFNADPRTGFAVYDSFAYSGWTVVGGTSAGAPQWAALVAIANQARVSNHLGTLDGSTGTLPMLYALYHDPSAYAAAFNDVTSGRSYYSSHVGYDGVTGLGTPKVQQVVLRLAGLAGGSSTTTTTPAATATPPTTTGTTTTGTTPTRRTHVRRTVTVPAAPAQLTSIPFSFAPTINTLSVVGIRDVLSPSYGSSTMTLRGGFAAASSIFTATFYARTTADVLSGTFSLRPVVRLPLMVASVGGSAPTVATGANPGDGGQANAATPVIPEVVAVAPRLFNFVRVDWFNAFTDAWGALAEESASTVVRNNVKRIRAWTITAAVAAADVMLLSYWYARRRKAKQRAAGFGVGIPADQE